MRDQGRLVEWFDEQGYGFIQPNDLTKPKVFLHIKDFVRSGPRPIVGCALEYTVNFDERGRYRAQQVIYLKAAQVKASSQSVSTLPSTAAKRPLMQVWVMIYAGIILGLSLAKLLPAYSLMFIICMNVLNYWLYAQDKEAAQLGHRRIPEQTLHVVSFLGGWPAAWYAQQKLRHKTQKQPFRQIYFCTIAFHILFIIWLISPLNVFA